MKEGFALLTNLDEIHNNIHRKAFMTPETDYVTSDEPTLDTLKLGERRVYKTGGKYWLYQRLSKTEIGKIEFTIV
jgi:hypothetical protein